jgi:deazaflavin-dependent oxidoreductase (nitroreductase family)
MDADDLATLADEAYCYLTTTGRRSGQPHEIEIWFAVLPKRPALYLISGGGDTSHWVRNLLARPEARVRIGDDHVGVRARLPLEQGDERRQAYEALHAKYGAEIQGSQEDWPAGWLADAYLVALDLITDTGEPS